MGQECPKCTENQAREMNKLLEYVSEKKPELLRIAIQKYVLDSGINLPADSRFAEAVQVDDDIEIPEVKDDENADWAKEFSDIDQNNERKNQTKSVP